jgi:hypothetical protein
MRVTFKENPPTVRCKKSGNAKLYTDSTAINMSYLEDFLTSLAEALAHSTVIRHGVSGGLDGPSEGQFRPGCAQD